MGTGDNSSKIIANEVVRTVWVSARHSHQYKFVYAYINICTSYPLTISLFVLARTIRQRTFEDMRNNQDIGGTCAVRSNQRCNPKTWDKYQGYIDGCCTSEQRCGAGEGDCTDDSDCMPGLVCGKNNCPKDQGFGNRADCCEPFSDEFNPGKYVPAIFLDKLMK